ELDGGAALRCNQDSLALHLHITNVFQTFDYGGPGSRCTKTGVLHSFTERIVLHLLASALHRFKERPLRVCLRWLSLLLPRLGFAAYYSLIRIESNRSLHDLLLRIPTRAAPFRTSVSICSTAIPTLLAFAAAPF